MIREPNRLILEERLTKGSKEPSPRLTSVKIGDVNGTAMPDGGLE